MNESDKPRLDELTAQVQNQERDIRQLKADLQRLALLIDEELCERKNSGAKSDRAKPR